MKSVFFKGLIFMIPMLFTTLVSMSQNVIKGKIVDSQTKEPLIGATITLEGTSVGTSTMLDGDFLLKTDLTGKQTVVFRCVGYKEDRREITVIKEVSLGTVGLQTDVIGLGDVTITASVAVDRKTPVAVSVIDAEEIENKLSNQEFPEIFKSTPGVYATKMGGGFGDSRFSIRGFEPENVAVMVNGVPMNDMEHGGTYWSNWSGLSDVTRIAQVQRGLGAAKVSAPSVGGSVNIVTKSTDVTAGGSIAYAMGNDGYNKVSFNVSTGLNRGWALSLLGAKSWGDGYAQGTKFEGYSYFGNISKQINDAHLLSLTVFGAPQWHNQRKDMLQIAEWEKQTGKRRYNSIYGFDMNGQEKTSGYNFYHKPQISLNHFWTINEKSSLATVLYTSIGRGGGYTGQGAGNYRNKWYGTSTDGLVNTEFRSADGTFDYGAIYALNKTGENGSLMAMSSGLNHHNWYGLISTYTSSLGKYFNVNGGIDFRYYKGIHRTELVDLYGGEYFVDNDSRKNVSYKKDDIAWQNEKLKVGDVVYKNYDGYAVQEGVFGQGQFNKDALNAFVAASLSNTTYWRYDHFYYDKEHAKSDKVNFLGYTVKGGINYNLTEKHNVYANVGYISRAPFFATGVFLNKDRSNEMNKDAVNEKVFSAEIGYGFRSKFLTAHLNLYRIGWSDKTMIGSFTLGQNKIRSVVNLEGVDASHKGIELDFVIQPIPNLDINGMVSIGYWRWTNNASGYAYDDAGNPIDKTGNPVSQIGGSEHAKVTMNLKGVRVGNSAQTTAAGGVKYQLMRGLRAGIDYTFFGRNYAKYKMEIPRNLDDPQNFGKAWRIPSVSLLDANMSYQFAFGKLNAVISGNVNNLFDKEYITDAEDNGTSGNRDKVKVFYGFGRTYSVRLRLNF